jgi:His/Glu/Gln/Arg/opine family amino acid ABC transporter permease subunit
LSICEKNGLGTKAISTDTMLHFDLILPSIPYIIGGVGVTLQYTLVSICGGLILGSILALFKISGSSFLRGVANAYTSIFRGTPLLLQLGIVYFALPNVLGVTLPPFVAGILTFSLNSGAYISEILRAGIQSVDVGQKEACLSLNIPRHKALKDIILPQAIRNTLPSLVNEVIDLLKESALISIIGEADLLRRANIVAAEKYLYLEPLLIAGGCYYILVLGLASLAKLLENRLKTT